MESKTNYTIVGLMVLILSFGFLIVSLWLSIGFDKKQYNKYIVYMQESISGLNEQSIVKYNGVKVGFVDHIELSHADPQTVKILLKIQKGTPITTRTQATLVTQGITGSTYLGLSASSPTSTPLQKPTGELYPVIPYKPSFFARLEKNFTKLSDRLNQVLSEENINHLNQTLTNLQTLTEIFEKNKVNLDRVLNNLPELTQDLKISIQQFSTMSKDVSVAGKQVSSAMKAGRNTMNKISQQTIPPAVLLLRRMDLIAANLEKMSAQLRQNPAIIVRGSASPKVGPGEKL